MAHWHDFNPWADKLIYVPDLEELAECVVTSRSKHQLIKHWSGEHKLLDGYILPHYNNGKPDHSIGIRYGWEGHEYYSPLANQEKTDALVKKYGAKP